MASLAMCALLTAIITLLAYLALFHLPLEHALAGTVCCTFVGMLWVSLAFCGAVRDYRGVTASFIIGLLIAVSVTVGAAWLGLGTPALVLSFCVGLSVIFFGLTSRVLGTFPQPVTQLLEPFWMLIAGMWHNRVLALGALLATSAIWIDKWIMWAGPAGARTQNGLFHAPTYDSAMFIAYLAIIPALASFVTTLETTFFDTYRKYYGSIANHGTLAQIRKNAGELGHETTRALTRITLLQATLCAIVVLLAPLIVEATGLHFEQIGILRMGAIGAIFQFLFLACSSLLLFFARDLRYLYLQLLFFLTQAGFTLYTIALGVDYYGFGYLVSCVICGVFSFYWLECTVQDIEFLTFMVGIHRRQFITRTTPDAELKEKPRVWQVPGTPAAAFSYLIKPFSDQLARAFRER
jgi:uncharacterized membrane protein